MPRGVPKSGKRKSKVETIEIVKDKRTRSDSPEFEIKQRSDGYCDIFKDGKLAETVTTLKKAAEYIGEYKG